MIDWSHTSITPITYFDGWCAKREDYAFKSGANTPSGLKVRQFVKMCSDNPGVPMVVGCSADSAMQIYVAWASKQLGVPATIFVPRRKKKSSATKYAMAMGAEVHEVYPGYATVYRKHARDYARAIGGAVRWNPFQAIHDTAIQCMNLPTDVKRVIVPTGSGLVAAGVMAGLAIMRRPDIEVVAVCVSDLANEDNIRHNCNIMVDAITKAYYDPILRPEIPVLSMQRTSGGYGDWVFETMPDNSVLDPFYSAKAMPYIQDGDCLWASGMRPYDSCPDEWKILFDEHQKNIIANCASF